MFCPSPALQGEIRSSQHRAGLQHVPRLKRSGRFELPPSPSGHQPHCGALVLHSFSQKNWMVLQGLSGWGRSWHRQQATSLGTWLETRGHYWRSTWPPDPWLQAQLREHTDTPHGSCASPCATALGKSPHSQCKTLKRRFYPGNGTAPKIPPDTEMHPAWSSNSPWRNLQQITQKVKFGL